MKVQGSRATPVLRHQAIAGGIRGAWRTKCAGCGRKIEVDSDGAGHVIDYNLDGSKHKCPGRKKS